MLALSRAPGQGVRWLELLLRAESEVHLLGTAAGDELVAVEPPAVNDGARGELHGVRIDRSKVHETLRRADVPEGKPLRPVLFGWPGSIIPWR
jgi:hypothetical protein